MTFVLPPEANDRTVTVTIPKEVDPYFKEWYLATKKTGESPEDFAYRNLAKAGLAYRAQKLQNEQAIVIKDLIDNIRTDADTIILDNNLD